MNTYARLKAYCLRHGLEWRFDTIYSPLHLIWEIIKLLNTVVTDVDDLKIKMDDLIESLEGSIETKVIEQLQEWLNDGTLTEIIDHNLLEQKADKSSLESIGINVFDYGIIGDGTTDVTIPLQALIDMLSNYVWDLSKENTYRNVAPVRLIFPKGVYLITDTIKIPPYMTFEGVHTSFGNNYIIDETAFGLVDFKKMGTVFLFKTTTNKGKFAFNLSPYLSDGTRDTNINRIINGPASSFEDRLEGVNIKNITVKSYDGNDIGAFYLNGSPFNNFENVNILGFDIGAFISNSWNVRFTKCGVFTKNYGIYAYMNVNNLSIKDSTLNHYYLWRGDGLGDRVYTTDQINSLYPVEGNFNPSTHYQLTTGLYMFNALHVSITDTTVENWGRGVFGYQSTVKVDTVWLEANKVVDIQGIHTVATIVNVRKETEGSKLARATGSSRFNVVGISGSNSTGTFVNDVANLIEYKDTSAVIVFADKPYTLVPSSSIHQTRGLKFDIGGTEINAIKKIKFVPTAEQVGVQQVIPFPHTSLYNQNTSIISAYTRSTNNVETPFTTWTKANGGIVFTPQSTVPHFFILIGTEE